MTLTPVAKQIEESLEITRADESKRHPRSAATIEEELLDNVPLPSVADPTDNNLLMPKTLLDCCRCAQASIDEHDLGDGLDAGDLNMMRVLGHHARMNTQFAYLRGAAERKDKHCYLWCLMNILRLVCCMTNEAGLETVLSAAFSLKHETDMKRTFSSLQEAQDKAKEMKLSPEKVAKRIRETPNGRFALYDEARDEPVHPDDWKQPDFRSLTQVAQTEQGRSEVSCVLDHEHPDLTMARPMIFTDATHPSHFTFANQAGVQTDEDASNAATIPDELRRTIDSHLWLTNLEVSSGITPTMATRSHMPREPDPNGPTRLTVSQLSDAQLALTGAHVDQDVSQRLKGVVTNMHLLAKFSREAGFVPHLGYAHYIYACYLKSQINSSRPPSTCDLGTVWSLQVDLDKDMPKACALALTPSLSATDPSGITLHATRAPHSVADGVRLNYCGCDIQLHSAIEISDESSVHVVSECQDEITTVVIDEVHNRSAHSDYVLALTFAMQKSPDLRLVLMSPPVIINWCRSESHIVENWS